jgi:hypothetical protein
MFFDKNPLNKYFPIVWVLNQEKRKDRLEIFEQRAKHQDLQYKVFKSVPHPRSFTSFNLSVLCMLAYFYETGHDRMLMLEDDVEFSEDYRLQFTQSVGELPDNWELFYLGCNIIENGHEPYSTNLARIRAAWTTHAVGIRRSVAEEILSQPYNVHEGMIDDYFAKKICPKGNAYACRPMIATQRPVYSDLWGKHADYTGLFQTANDKIK